MSDRTPAANADPWLDATDAAARAHCSAKTINRAAKAGKLRSVRLAGNLRYRFRASWIDAWLEGGGDSASEAKPENRPESDAALAGGKVM